MRTGDEWESVGSVCHVLLGPVVLAVALAGCSAKAGSPGPGQSTSTGGLPGVGGSAGGGIGSGGVNAVGNGGSSTSSGGTPAGGSGALATAGSAGSPTGGSNAGGGAGGAAGGAGGAGPTGVAVKLDSVKQMIQGFGVNDTWAPAMTDAAADAMFSTSNGIGLTILRVGMDDKGGFMSTNIAGDIAKAKARGVTKIIGSCWSPLATQKSGQPSASSENGGGHVNANAYTAWATTIAKFAKDNGLYAMSIANEPDFASCGSVEPCNGDYQTTLYTANEMVAFIKVAGPMLKAAGVKVIAPEASEWIHTWSNTSASGSVPSGKNSSDPLKCGFPPSNAACNTGGGYDYGHYLYKDSAAWAAVDIMGVHQYDSQVAEPWPSDVPDKKEVWQTEMSGVKWWPEQGPSSDINNGVVVAGWIHNALTVGEASAWTWWWWNANNTDDNEGLYLKSGADTKRHYTFGNFSKFIRPGYTRVDVTGNTSTDVLVSAYKGTDGTVVVVAINQGSASATVPIAISGGTAPATLTPWVTSATDNLVSKTAVAVTGGSFTATLDTKTVTTFVGK